MIDYTADSITPEELEVLKNYTCDGGLALSIYIDLEPFPERERAAEVIERLAEQKKEELKINEESWESLREDLEIVRLYLKTNTTGARSLAIFSCAQEYFWRALPLLVRVPTHVHIAPRLDVTHLLSLFRNSHKKESLPTERKTEAIMA